MAEDIKQPEWFLPDETQGIYSGLQVYNSLTSSKVKFIPASGKRVGWYICGPTTYDSSHLGHARNYVTFDIIRRILEDYFGYDVFSVMNITDVDDKIILKARRTYLGEKYEKENEKLTTNVAKDLEDSWSNFIQSLQKKYVEVGEDQDKKKTEKSAEQKLIAEKLEEARKTQESVIKSIKELGTNGDKSSTELIKISKEPLSILVDNREGSTVRDQKIFRDLAAKYEAEFMEDMNKLNVRMPDVITRVTEYIEEIIEYVKKIIENGYAYVSNGSVYFDTLSFTKNHPYAKLEPKSVGNMRLVEEGEGSLTNIKGSEKKHQNDFALWKKSKEGEPQWDSPWGLGRPGWHIECSAMASSLLGTPLDIHSGGEDLRFPHHDNEIAQSEAYFNNNQWVNYFLHSGHLHINGLKMSKSLKNFITIRKALETYTPRQLRLLFLLQPWGRVINYSTETLSAVESKEKTISEFFLVIRYIISDQSNIENINQKWNNRDIDLHKSFINVQYNVDKSIKDNFDTSSAINHIMDIIKDTNKYLSSFTSNSSSISISSNGSSNDEMNNNNKSNGSSMDEMNNNNSNDVPKSLLLRKIGYYISKILRIFGVIFDKDLFSISSESSDNNNNNIIDIEQVVRPFVKAIAQFRSNVRNAASSKQNPSHFLHLCDDLRNDVMPPLGVRLEDEGVVPFKFDDPKSIMMEIAMKRDQAAAAAKKKIETKIKNIENELLDMDKGIDSPIDMFKKQGYNQFDNDGIPSIDLEGKEVSANGKKKLAKAHSSQLKLHNKRKDILSKDPDYIEKKMKEKQDLLSQL